ncbi:MAG: signal recognition particle-docking protein FtsY, partial [Myxococcota bacterium]
PRSPSTPWREERPFDRDPGGTDTVAASVITGSVLLALAPLLHSLAQQGPTAGGEGDLGALLFLGAFAALFLVLGVAFLRKRRKERLELLGRASEEADREHGLADYVSGKKQPPALDSSTSGALVPQARAHDLVSAEKDALAKKAAEERARRERERAEREAATAAVDDEREQAEARLAAARAKEEEARTASQEAQERAKQLRGALTATRDGFIGRISKVLGGRDIDENVLEDLETVLFTADIGARTAERLLNAVRQKLKARELKDAGVVQAALKTEVRNILAQAAPKPLALDGARPRVFMILGVNGSGKTTSIGKLAAQLKGEGHRVLLGAGDTFRSAAAEQLEVWGKRSDCEVVRAEKDGADPASVLFDAITTAKQQGHDVVLCDTAGRLHTKVNLMEELRKVARVIDKAEPGAPHEVLLVLDATVGQNAIAQAKEFGAAVPLTGIILTKLDGTATGGVIIGIADELKVPVRYIGVGEKIGDLRPFDVDTFTDALFGEHAADKNAAA